MDSIDFFLNICVSLNPYSFDNWIRIINNFLIASRLIIILFVRVLTSCKWVKNNIIRLYNQQRDANSEKWSKKKIPPNVRRGLRSGYSSGKRIEKKIRRKKMEGERNKKNISIKIVRTGGEVETSYAHRRVRSAWIM